MNTSVEINELATALAKAQAEMEGATKASANPYFKSKYADLASVRDACMGPLTKYGIAVVQSPSAEGAVVSVETTFLHTSGQWVSGIASATAKDDSPQSVGSICHRSLEHRGGQGLACRPCQRPHPLRRNVV